MKCKYTGTNTGTNTERVYNLFIIWNVNLTSASNNAKRISVYNLFIIWNVNWLALDPAGVEADGL